MYPIKNVCVRVYHVMWNGGFTSQKSCDASKVL